MSELSGAQIELLHRVADALDIELIRDAQGNFGYWCDGDPDPIYGPDCGWIEWNPLESTNDAIDLLDHHIDDEEAKSEVRLYIVMAFLDSLK